MLGTRSQKLVDEMKKLPCSFHAFCIGVEQEIEGNVPTGRFLFRFRIENETVTLPAPFNDSCEVGKQYRIRVEENTDS